MSTIVARSFKVFGNLLEKAGPYLLLELLLPGGTLFALLLWLYRQRQQLGSANVARASVVAAQAIGKVREEIGSFAQPPGVASLWRGRHRERDGLEALALAPV
jgi:hypothetical protein